MLTKRHLENLLPEFINFLSQRSSSRSTVSNYSSDLKRLFSQLPEVGEVSNVHFNDALANLRQTFSESTIRRFSYSLKAFQSWSATRGLSFDTPTPTVNEVAPTIANNKSTQTVSEDSKNDAVSGYSANLSEQGASLNSIRSLKADIFSFFKWLHPNLTQVDQKVIEQVKPSDIKRYVSFLKSRQIPETSIGRYIYSLHSFFNFSKKK